MTVKINKQKNSSFYDFVSVEDMQDSQERKSLALTSPGTASRDQRLSNTALSNFLNSNLDNQSRKSGMPPGTPVDQSWGGLRLNAKKPLRKVNIPDIVTNLRGVEKEISKLDVYVAYCVKKYKQFKYEIKNFANDSILLQTIYIEAHLVE